MKKPTKKGRLKTVAILTIHDAAEMTPMGISRIESWLKHQIRILRDNSDQLAKRYTARYLYEA